MTLSDLIRELFRRGIILNLDGTYNLKIRSLTAPIHQDLVELLKQRKPELLNYLKRAYSLKIGMLVKTPGGIGRVWEFYPALDRCGVIIGDCTWPQFFSIMDLEVGNVPVRHFE